MQPLHFPAEQKVCERFDLYSDIDDLMRVKHLLYLLTRCISCDIFGFVQACHYYRTYSNDEAYGKLRVAGKPGPQKSVLNMRSSLVSILCSSTKEADDLYNIMNGFMPTSISVYEREKAQVLQAARVVAENEMSKAVEKVRTAKAMITVSMDAGWFTR